MTLRLDWTALKDPSITQVKDPESKNVQTSAVTYTIGIIMLHTGTNDISTDEQCAEFYARAVLVEACYGGGLIMRVVNGVTINGITPEDVFAHKGLKSNVNTYTPAQFFSHLRKNVYGELRTQFGTRVGTPSRELRAGVRGRLEERREREAPLYDRLGN